MSSMSEGDREKKDGRKGKDKAERGADGCMFRNIRYKVWLKGKKNCFCWLLLCDLNSVFGHLSWFQTAFFSSSVFTLTCCTCSLLTVLYVFFSAMGLRSTLGGLLFFLGPYGICSGFVQGESHCFLIELHMNTTRALRILEQTHTVYTVHTCFLL